MEARVRNEMAGFLKRLEEAHAAVLGDLAAQFTEEQRRAVEAAFLQVIDEVISLVKKGKDVHERFVQNLVLNSIDAIVGVDNNEKIFFWNRGAELTFGYAAEEVIGRVFGEFLPERLRDEGEMARLREETFRVGYVRAYRTERLTKEGRTVQVSLSRTLVRDQDGTPLGYVAVIRDITRMLELQMEVEQAERLALVGRLAAGIAHEVGSPLNVILGTAQMMQQGKSASDPDAEELQTIINQIGRINRLIQQLLNYARPERIRFEELSLAEQMRGATAFLRGRFEGLAIDLRVEIEPDLPLLRGDRDQIQQVLINLLMNACDAFPADRNGRENRIVLRARKRIGAAAEGSVLRLEVEDNGAGIPAEHIPSLFEPFFTTKEVGRGTGLGLAVSRRIVEEHGGRIGVQSRVGEGTLFTIDFPIIPSA